MNLETNQSNKFLKHFLMLIFLAANSQCIFSMEQYPKISDAQMKLQISLKNAIATYNETLVRIALSKGANINLETQSIAKELLNIKTTPFADALISMIYIIDNIEKDMPKTISKYAILGISTPALLAASVIGFILSMSKFKSSALFVSSLMAASISTFLSFEFINKYIDELKLKKEIKEKYDNALKILKLIRSQKNFKLDKFSEKLCKEAFPKLNKILVYLESKKPIKTWK